MIRRADKAGLPVIIFLDAVKYETGADDLEISPVAEDEWALLFCVNGETRIVGHSIHIAKQQALLTKLESPLRLHDSTPGHTMIHIRFAFAQDAAGAEHNPIWQMTGGYPAVIPLAGNVYRLLTEILYECFRQSEGYQKTCTYLMELVLARLLCVAEHREDKSSPDYAGEVREYLMRHYAEKVTLSDLVQYFWVSVSHLQNQFKARYGTTIIAWLNEYRYHRACELMERERVPMKEALFRSGISSRQQYYRLKKAIPTCRPARNGGEP